jgi:hypothetical protein
MQLCLRYGADQASHWTGENIRKIHRLHLINRAVWHFSQGMALNPVLPAQASVSACCSRHHLGSRTLPIAGLLVIVLTCSASNTWAQKATPAETLKSATETAGKIREATGSKPAAKAIPAGNPCDIISSSGVQKAFPGAKTGERSTHLKNMASPNVPGKARRARWCWQSRSPRRKASSRKKSWVWRYGIC